MIILRFVYNPGLLEPMITFDSNEPGGFCHVEAVTPDGKYLGAHVDGVAARPMDWDAGKFTKQKFMLLPADAEMTAKWIHYLRAVIGEPYDFSAIAAFVSHFDMRQKHHTICSALQTLALRWCEYFPISLPVPAHRVSVRDLELGLTMRPDVREIEPTDPIFIAHIAGT
jgi:hypothetical protein